MGRKVKLPSGAELDITMAPFGVSKAVYMAIAQEAKAMQMSGSIELDTNFWKDVLCTMISSPKIEEALDECMKRCTYKGNRILTVPDTFESAEARGDYFSALYEVAVENVAPFTKNLYAQFAGLIEQVKAKLGTQV